MHLEEMALLRGTGGCRVFFFFSFLFGSWLAVLSGEGGLWILGIEGMGT